MWEGRGLLPLLLLPIADALRRCKSRQFRYCGHLQCDERHLDHCCPQRRSIFYCGHVAAELRTGDIRRRPRCVVCVDGSDCKGMVCGEGEVVGPLLLIAYALRRCQCRCCQHCGHVDGMPCWIPLHHWFISLVLAVRPRHLQPFHRPILVRLLQPRHVCQHIRSLPVLLLQ